MAQTRSAGNGCLSFMPLVLYSCHSTRFYFCYENGGCARQPPWGMSRKSAGLLRNHGFCSFLTLNQSSERHWVIKLPCLLSIVSYCLPTWKWVSPNLSLSGGLYAQFLRVLLRKSLITPDDYEVYQQICPLFDPVYAPEPNDGSKTCWKVELKLI